MRTERRNLLIKMFFLFIFARVMMKLDAYLAYTLTYEIWEEIPIRIILSVVMLSFVYRSIDKTVFAWSWKKCGYALTRLSPQLLLSILLSVLVVIFNLSEYKVNIQSVILPAVGYLILALVVSLYEEGLYRGIITGGLQRIISQNRRGVTLTVLLSGAVFGVVHITSYLYIVRYNPSIVLFEMFTRFMQIGSTGVLFAVVYLKNRNIWGGIVVHFLWDVIPFLASLTESQSDRYLTVNADVHVHMTKEQIFIRIIITAILFTVNMLITWRIIENMHKGKEEDTNHEVEREEISVTTDSVVEE